MDQGVDVVALGNMCVDILPPPAPIPKPETLKTEAMLAELTAASPNQASWEVGGKDWGLGFFLGHASLVPRPFFSSLHSLVFPSRRLLAAVKDAVVFFSRHGYFVISARLYPYFVCTCFSGY